MKSLVSYTDKKSNPSEIKFKFEKCLNSHEEEIENVDEVLEQCFLNCIPQSP